MKINIAEFDRHSALAERFDEVENVTHCRSPYVENHRLFNPTSGELTELNCKSWRCPKHRASWQFKWRTVLIRECEAYPITKLITLTTAGPCTITQLSMARQLCFRSIRETITEFEYFSVLEFNARGTQPHLHLMARCNYIQVKTLSRLWKEATTAAGMKPAFKVWIAKPDSQAGSAVYILSYALGGHEKGQDIPDSWVGRKITYSRKFFHSPVSIIWGSWIEETFGKKDPGDESYWVVIAKHRQSRL